MQTQEKLSPAPAPILTAIFIAVLVGRFAFPFLHNPMDNLYLDMQRHFDNGKNLLHPGFVGGIDPKFYQLWMYLLELFPAAYHRIVFAFTNGLLCAALPLFWYKALREITTKRNALMLGIIIGVHLSFLVIYEFFLMETVMLTAVALASWMTLRSIRKGTLTAFSAAALCWMVAAFTKQTVIPLMLISLGYALYTQTQKIRALLVAIGIFTAFVIPAGLQGYAALHYFAPFGCMEMQSITRKADSTTFAFNISNHNHIESVLWTPEAFHFNQLEPIGTFTSKRSEMPYSANIDLAHGRTDWQAALDEVEDYRAWHDVLNEYKENFVFLFFGNSYPDSTPLNTMLHETPGIDGSFWMQRWNFHLRWIWPLCMVFVLICGPLVKMPPSRIWLLLITYAMIWAFLLQDSGVVEGRYRKLIEPFILFSVFFMIEAMRAVPRPEHTNLKNFVLQVYIHPFLQRLVRPVFAATDKTA